MDYINQINFVKLALMESSLNRPKELSLRYTVWKPNLLCSSLITSLILRINPTEIWDDNWYWKGNNKDSRQRTYRAKKFSSNCRRDHITITKILIYNSCLGSNILFKNKWCHVPPLSFLKNLVFGKEPIEHVFIPYASDWNIKPLKIFQEWNVSFH